MNYMKFYNTAYYRQIAHLYDIMYNAKTGCDHKVQVDWVDEWRSKLELPKVVLDLACGTGSHLAEFESLGYRCFGIDATDEMLDIARRRLKSTVLQRGRFHDFQLPSQVPLVTCFFNSMAYNTTGAEFRETLRRIRSVLHPGGLFVFDMVCTEEPETTFAVKTFEEGDLKFSRTFVGIPTERGYESLMCLVVLNGAKTDVIQASTLRGMYSVDDVRSMLLDAGYEALYQGAGHSTMGSTVFAAKVSIEDKPKQYHRE